MKPLYALLRDRCGLSLPEAAAFHEVSVNTVNKWSSGARNPPPGVLTELRELYARIESAAGISNDGRGDRAAMEALPDGALDAARGLLAMKEGITK